MSSVNPVDAPGYTQMYTFGVKTVIGQRVEYLVMTVRAISEEAARRHIVAIFRGNYNFASLQFFTDMDIWKNEARTEAIAFDKRDAYSTPIQGYDKIEEINQ